MAWPNPFRKQTENTRNCWGYTFELTPEHLTPEQSDKLKYTYDVLGEECLKKLNEICPPPDSALPRNNGAQVQEQAEKDRRDRADSMEAKRADSPMENDRDSQRREPDEEKAKTYSEAPAHRDLYALLRDHHEEDEKLNQLWTELNTIPEWVDWDQIARGQEVFYRYGSAILTGLAYQSLLGGMGAARVVEVLARTGGFSTKVARRRLYETTQHILQCTKSLESIQPGGAGFASTIRVRLLHAAVRMRIMKLAAQKPDYYSVEKYGIPINDLDSIATIGTFSGTLIWLSLPRQGIFLREQEITDYIALWRYIAYLVGCPTEYFERKEQAKMVMETLLLYEVHPSDTSGVLANNIILSLKDKPPTWASADMLIASARWLNGNDLCDALQLPRPSLYYWALMTGQIFFQIIFTYPYRFMPEWDKAKIERLRKIFYALIVESKTGLGGKETMFEFQYVPEFNTVTEMGKDGKAEVGERGVDKRNLKYFLIGMTGLAATTWCTAKLVSLTVRGAIGAVGYAWNMLR